MRRTIAVALLAFATIAGAGDQKPARQKGDQPKQQPAPIDPGIGRSLKLAKAKLTAAAGACASPAECDPASRAANRDAIALLEEAEKGFMAACQACSTEEKCDAERARIRDGRRSPGLAPCR